jgi:hypothetical protein
MIRQLCLTLAAALLGSTTLLANAQTAGHIGAMKVVRAAPDGHILFLGSSSSVAANVSLR